MVTVSFLIDFFFTLLDAVLHLDYLFFEFLDQDLLMFDLFFHILKFHFLCKYILLLLLPFLLCLLLLIFQFHIFNPQLLQFFSFLNRFFDLLRSNQQFLLHFLVFLGEDLFPLVFSFFLGFLLLELRNKLLFLGVRYVGEIFDFSEIIGVLFFLLHFFLIPFFL